MSNSGDYEDDLVSACTKRVWAEEDARQTKRRAPRKPRGARTPTRRQIEAALADALADERLSYTTATTFENAPLAMIQLELETRARVLSWVLGVPFVHPRTLAKETKR